MTDVDGYTLTSEQAAAQLGVPLAAVRQWLWRGDLPGYRVGGNAPGWRIRATDLGRFRTAAAGAVPALPTDPQEA